MASKIRLTSQANPSPPEQLPLAKQKFQINSPSITRIQRIMRDSFIEKKITLKNSLLTQEVFIHPKTYPMRAKKTMCVFTVM